MEPNGQLSSASVATDLLTRWNEGDEAALSALVADGGGGSCGAWRAATSGASGPGTRFKRRRS